MVVYGETLVPTYRRRGVRMNDVVTLVRGLEEAAVSLGPAAEADAIREPMTAWIERLRRHRRLPGDHAGNKACPLHLEGRRSRRRHGRLMTIKWVKSDPLVMNGEPFCYGTRLTVRNLLEMRANGLTPAEMLAEHPELRRVGIAEAFLLRHRAPGALRGVLRGGR